MPTSKPITQEKKQIYEAALPVGTVLTKGERPYTIDEVLGAGGFGITYRVSAVIMVHNVPIRTNFAVKEFFMNGGERAADGKTVRYTATMRQTAEESRNDFLIEAKRLNRLSGKSRNIVRVNESFEENNTAYYVMQYLEGGDLYEYVMKNGPMTEAMASAVIKPIAEAVGLIHQEMLLHLDIKPDNILLMTSQADGGRYPVLIDFGIAKHFSKSGKPTSFHNAKGASAGYAPQEQYGNIDHFEPEMDVYALGATLLFLLSGKTPKTAFDITEQDIREQLPSTVSKRTCEAVVKAMKQRKAERTSNVGEFIASLEDEYTLPFGFLLTGKNGDTYRITGIERELPGCIVYNALREGDADSQSPDNGNDHGRNQIHTSGTAVIHAEQGGSSTPTVVLHSDKTRRWEDLSGCRLVFELFVKPCCKRSDDGTVTGVTAAARQQFDDTVGRYTSKNGIIKGKEAVLLDEFPQNGTIYRVCALKEIPSVWVSVWAAVSQTLRRIAKPLLYTAGSATVAAGLFVGGKAVFRSCEKSAENTAENKKETVVASSSKDTMNIAGGEEVSKPEEPDPEDITEPKPVIPDAEDTDEPKPAPVKELTNDEKYAQAVRDNNHAELIRLAKNNYAKAYYDVASYYFSLKDYANAKKYAQKAVNANVNKAQAQSLIAKIDEAQQQTRTDKKTDAEMLAEAKAKGDWTTVKRLADKGYGPALVPLAANYAHSGKYDSADKYAQAAKKRGIRDARDVINYLDELGYYDDKNDSIASF